MKKNINIKNKKILNNVVTFLIIISVVLIAFFSFVKSPDYTEEKIAKCIGENSVLYVLPWCGHCRIQEDMFGDNLKYITIVDCYKEPEKCSRIKATPTWIIDNKEYIGTQSIETLREATGC
jgi:hypothetical protein